MQRLGSGHPLAAQNDFAFTDHHRGQVCERREIARGANRSLRRYDRYQVVMEQGLQLFDHAPANAGCATTERQQLERNDQPHYGARQWFTDATAVRQNQVALQARGLLGRDAGAGEFAKPGIDTVNRCVTLSGPGDHGRRRVDTFAAARVDDRGVITPVNVAKFRQACLPRHQCQRCHLQ